MLPTTHRFDEVFAPVAVVEETSPEAPTVAMADNDPEAAPWNWDLAPHRMHVVEEYLGSEEIVLPGGAGQWELVWLGGLSSLLPAQGRKAFRSWPCRPLRSSTVCGRVSTGRHAMPTTPIGVSYSSVAISMAQL